MLGPQGWAGQLERMLVNLVGLVSAHSLPQVYRVTFHSLHRWLARVLSLIYINRTENSMSFYYLNPPSHHYQLGMSTNSTSHHHHHSDNSGYGYTPTFWICVLFVVLYSLSCIAHTLQGLVYRKWWMLPTMSLGCIGEIIGWSGRLWSSQNVKLLNPFLIQISTTVVSPSFMSAANFTILSIIIGRLGNQYAWLTPKWCTYPLTIKFNHSDEPVVARHYCLRSVRRCLAHHSVYWWISS